jgi:myosin heavy subunit
MNMRAPRKIKTLGSQFKLQLTTLMETLNSTQPHFIRCMKPNMEKVGRCYDSQVMLYQLRYAGFLEVCRIRQLGYPHRLSFDKFIKLYSILSTSNPSGSDGHGVGGRASVATAPMIPLTPRELLSHLLTARHLSTGQCVIGQSKVFMKHSVSSRLDMLRDSIYFSYAALIQKYLRGMNQRARYRLFKRTLNQLKSALATRDLIALEDAIAISVELPSEGINMPLVREAKSVLKRVKEEVRMDKLLEDAMSERQLLALETAIRTAKGMNPVLESEALRRAIHLMEIVKTEKALLSQGSALLLKGGGGDWKEFDQWLQAAQSHHTSLSTSGDFSSLLPHSLRSSLLFHSPSLCLSQTSTSPSRS